MLRYISCFAFCLLFALACGKSRDAGEDRAGGADAGGEAGGAAEGGSGDGGGDGTMSGAGGMSGSAGGGDGAGTDGGGSGDGGHSSPGDSDAGPSDAGSGTDAGGAGSGEQPGRCDEQCDSAEDCGIGYTCSGASHCECISDDLCTAVLFGFHTEGCATDDDCDGATCIQWAATTFCAEVSGDQYAICLSPQGNRLELERADASGIVVICHSGRPILCMPDTKRCERGCTGNGHCAFEHPGMRTCDEESSRCVCTKDQDTDSCNHDLGYQCKDNGQCGCYVDDRCAGGYSADGPHCNVTTAECECQSHDECAGSGNGTYCLNGKCGCRSAAECSRPKAFEGTKYACVPE